MFLSWCLAFSALTSEPTASSTASAEASWFRRNWSAWVSCYAFSGARRRMYAGFVNASAALKLGGFDHVLAAKARV